MEFRQDPESIRERIINDCETTETLLYMVETSFNVIKENEKYSILKKVLGEILQRHDSLKNEVIKERVQELFVCGSLDDANIHDMKPSFAKKNAMGELKAIDRMTEKLLVEFLRFLAMKVLLQDVETFDHTAGVNETRFCLVPSLPLRDCWKALLMLPVMYAELCVSMGLETEIDYDADDYDLEYKRGKNKNKVKDARTNYRRTLITYEKLYLVIPDEQCWLRLQSNDAEDYDPTFKDDIRNFVDGVSSYVKQRVTGRETSLPKTIRFSTTDDF